MVKRQRQHLAEIRRFLRQVIEADCTATIAEAQMHAATLLRNHHRLFPSAPLRLCGEGPAPHPQPTASGAPPAHNPTPEGDQL